MIVFYNITTCTKTVLQLFLTAVSSYRFFVSFVHLLFLLCRFLTQGNRLQLGSSSHLKMYRLSYPFSSPFRPKERPSLKWPEFWHKWLEPPARVDGGCNRHPQNCSCDWSIFLQCVPRYIPAITQKGRGLQRKQTSKDQWFVKQWHGGVTVTSGAESNSSLYRKL